MTPTVTVYQRPGCGFCSALVRSLDRNDIAYGTVDIWQDEEAAAFVRSVAGGNETVPTVVIEDPEGDTVALVNPSPREVIGLVEGEAEERRRHLWHRRR